MSQRRPMLILTAVALLAAALVLFFFDPAQGGFYPRCQFHKLTGLNCPGCGSLRSLHHLTHGEFRAAFQSNPLLMMLLPWLAFLAAAVSTPLGTLLSYPMISRIDPSLLGALLSISAGALIYVGATHLLPQAERESAKYSLVALAAGILVAAGIIASKG